MPNYICEQCNKTFIQKSNYTKHISKKFPCQPQSSKITQQATEEIICNYCQKTFTRKYHLLRHIDNNCKVKRGNDAKMEEMMERLIKIEEANSKNEIKIQKLQEENRKYRQQITTQNNTQNNNVTITINAYGSEDISKISVSKLKSILRRGMMSVPALVETMHFDKNIPENHNVYISNMRDNYVLMFDGKKWCLKDRNLALDQIYEDKCGILETEFEKLLNMLDEPTIKMFERFLEVKDEDSNDKHIVTIKQELKQTLYDNRNIAKRTRKEREKIYV
jgi:uncharacterized C2H2 Zn-finger protein